MDKIQTISSSLRTFFSVLIPLPAISLIIIWLSAAYQHCHVLAVLFGFPDDSITLSGNVSISINIFGFLLFHIMVSVQTYLFLQLRRLFSEYTFGKIFTLQNTKLLNRISLTFLSLTLISILVISLCSLFLIAKNITEFRALLITAGILQVCNISISITLLVITWVIEEGRIIKEDCELTI